MVRRLLWAVRSGRGWHGELEGVQGLPDSHHQSSTRQLRHTGYPSLNELLQQPEDISAMDVLLGKVTHEQCGCFSVLLGIWLSNETWLLVIE